MDTTRDAPPQATEGTTLSDQVYEAIVSMIVGGHYAVGSKLPTEQALCEEFQVSRPVLRQALKQLREDGVIVSRQGSGSYVQRRPDGAMLDFAPVGSIADIQRTFEFRAAIEGEAAYIAALRRNQNDLDVMSATLTELDRCIRDGELGVEADEAFHAAVCAAADNKYFLAARNAIRSNILVGMDVNRNLSLIGPQERLRLVQSEHYAVIAAIEQGDAETARQAMRDHVENARRRVFDGS